MADRPILFSAPMVRALIGGRKTQTRRVYVPKALWDDEVRRTELNAVVWPIGGFGQQCGLPSPLPRIQCGDRLWVREAWRADTNVNHLPPRDIPPGSAAWYPADDGSMGATPLSLRSHKTRPSMFMPRWASRLTLIVTDVRVERLHGISEADAIAEGVEYELTTSAGRFYRNYQNLPCPMMAYGSYRSLWEAINGPGSWEANPWVAAYTFEVKRDNIDRIGGSDG